MPHIIIEGPASVESFYRDFTPVNIREQNTILKIEEAYLSTDRMNVLLDCVVVEDRNLITFYLHVAQKEGKITVHIDSMTDPEKTDGVKRLIAFVGHKLKAQNPACRYGQTNLAEYLRE